MSVISLPVASPHLVVFGRDQSGKPHASWFDQASAELATKAATLMSMRAVPIEGEELRTLVGSLPRGRVFSSGRAFTPFVKSKLYERLVELTRDLLGAGSEPVQVAMTSTEAESEEGHSGEDDGAVAGGEKTVEAPPPATGAPRPSEASTVGLGSLVLAEDRTDGGWFEALVIGVNGTMLTLRWRDYNEPTIVRRANELGFLPALAV